MYSYAVSGKWFTQYVFCKDRFDLITNIQLIGYGWLCRVWTHQSSVFTEQSVSEKFAILPFVDWNLLTGPFFAMIKIILYDRRTSTLGHSNLRPLDMQQSHPRFVKTKWWKNVLAYNGLKAVNYLVERSTLSFNRIMVIVTYRIFERSVFNDILYDNWHYFIQVCTWRKIPLYSTFFM